MSERGREQALKTAKRYCRARFSGWDVPEDSQAVVDVDELGSRAMRVPSFYGVPLREVWLVYLEAKAHRPIIRPSVVIGISKITGDVVYVGSAHDEG